MSAGLKWSSYCWPSETFALAKRWLSHFTSGSRHMRQDAVEHFASGGVGVESAIDEIAQTASGLRTAPTIGLFDRTALFLQRVDATGGIFGGIAQKAHEIVHGRMAQPERQWIAAGINQFVNPARLEPPRDVQMRI